jgi:hypothetical protein
MLSSRSAVGKKEQNLNSVYTNLLRNRLTRFGNNVNYSFIWKCLDFIFVELSSVLLKTVFVFIMHCKYHYRILK